jgi:hypothetical protein
MRTKSPKSSHDILPVGQSDDPENWIKIGQAWETKTVRGSTLYRSIATND